MFAHMFSKNTTKTIEAMLFCLLVYFTQSNLIVVSLRLFLYFQTRTDVHIDTKHQTMKGLSFPISEDAAHTLVDFKLEKVDYVQLVNTFTLIFVPLSLKTGRLNH